jgi:hypothetical protein
MQPTPFESQDDHQAVLDQLELDVPAFAWDTPWPVIAAITWPGREAAA